MEFLLYLCCECGCHQVLYDYAQQLGRVTLDSTGLGFINPAALEEEHEVEESGGSQESERNQEREEREGNQEREEREGNQESEGSLESRGNQEGEEHQESVGDEQEESRV